MKTVVHILYIEDDAGLAKAIMRFFRIAYPNAIVSHLDNSEQAIACLASIQFDVILCDYDLRPDTRGSGGSILTWIEHNQPHMKERFIFLSANEEGCANRGVLWLQKPTLNSIIKTSIDKILTNNSTN